MKVSTFPIIAFFLLIFTYAYPQLTVNKYLSVTDPITKLVKGLGANTTSMFNVKTNLTSDTVPFIGTFTNPNAVGLGAALKY